MLRGGKVVLAPPTSCAQLGPVSLNLKMLKWCICESNDNYYFLWIMSCLTLKSDLILLNILKKLNVYNDDTSKVILFLKINGFFMFNDTGLATRRFDNKINYNYITCSKYHLLVHFWYLFCSSLCISWYSPALPLINIPNFRSF